MKFSALIILVIISLSMAQDCNNPFFSQGNFDAIDVPRPPYLATPRVVNDLNVCNSFNGVDSCCDANTETSVKQFFTTFKKGVQEVAKKQRREIKDHFEQFKNVQVPGYANEAALKTKISNTVDQIKESFTNTTRNMNTCVQGAMRATVGLLCQGCDANYAQHQDASGNMQVAKDDALALANQCVKFFDSMERQQEYAMTAYMNITNIIASEVGEPDDTDPTQGNVDQQQDPNARPPPKNDDFASKFEMQNDDEIDPSQIQSLKQERAGRQNSEKLGFEYQPTRLLQQKFGQPAKQGYTPPTKTPPTKRTSGSTSALTLTNTQKNSQKKKSKPQLAASSICDDLTATMNAKNLDDCKLCAKPTTTGPEETNDNAKQTKIDGLVSNDAFCSGHPLLKKNTNGSVDQEFMNEYMTSGDNAVIPAMIKVKMFDSTGNVKGTILPFIFTDREKNKKVMNFLKNENIDNDVKQQMIEDTYQEIKRDVDGKSLQKAQMRRDVAKATAAGNAAPTRNYVGKQEINAAVGGNGKAAECLVKHAVMLAGPTNNPMKSGVNCTIKATYGSSADTDICGQSKTQDLTDKIFEGFDNCTNTTGKFQKLQLDCEDQGCRVCMDTNCFQQNFKAQPVKVLKKFNQTGAIEQFKANKRYDPQSGRKIPEYIHLPDPEQATNKPYTKPCDDLDSCATWTVQNMMNGPVANPLKLVNPQDDDSMQSDKMKQEARKAMKAQNVPDYDPSDFKGFNPDATSEADMYAPPTNSVRILTAQSASISSTGGVKFNDIAAKSSLDTSVAIDGETAKSSVFDSSTGDGSQSTQQQKTDSQRIMISIAFMLLMIMIQ